MAIKAAARRLAARLSAGALGDRGVVSSWARDAEDLA
jgi:hypothetical protein